MELLYLTSILISWVMVISYRKYASDLAKVSKKTIMSNLWFLTLMIISLLPTAIPIWFIWVSFDVSIESFFDWLEESV